jgi:hypothetical protein
VGTFVPDFYGTPLRNRYVLVGTNYNEQQLYPGLMTWILAVLALTDRQHRGRVLFFLVAGTCAVFLMFSASAGLLAAVLIPPLRVAALSRFGLIGITAVIIAGAIGLDALLQPDQNRREALRHMRLAITAAVAIVAIVGMHLWKQQPLLAAGDQWAPTLQSAMQAGALLAAAVTVVFICSEVRQYAAAWLPLALLIVDLLAFANGFHALLPREHTFPRVPELDIPQADRSVFRVAGWRDTLFPNTAVVYGLEDFRSYDGVGVRDYEDFLDIGFLASDLTHKLVNLGTPKLVDFLNIKYLLTPSDVTLPDDRFQLLSDGDTRVYRNRRVQPRAFLVDDAIVVRRNEARRAIRDRIDLTQTVVLDQPLEASAQPDRSTGDVGAAEIRRYGDQVATIATRADGRRLLVMSDVFYPGWVATIDGVAVPVHRANYAFRAVSVPAGDHIVEFRYRPASVRVGAWASLSGIVSVCALLIRGRRRER